MLSDEIVSLGRKKKEKSPSSPLNLLQKKMEDEKRLMGDFIDSIDFPFYQFLFFIYGESVMKLKTITITHNPIKEFIHSFTLCSFSTT